MAVDPKKFNTDPKHEAERNQFDELVESAIERIGARKKQSGGTNDAGGGGFFADLFEGLFGKDEK